MHLPSCSMPFSPSVAHFCRGDRVTSCTSQTPQPGLQTARQRRRHHGPGQSSPVGRRRPSAPVTAPQRARQDHDRRATLGNRSRGLANWRAHGTVTSPPVPLPRRPRHTAHAPIPPQRRRRDGRREGTFPARRRSRVLPHGRGAGGRQRAGGLWRERASHQPLHLLLPRLRRHVQQGLAAGRAPLPAHGPGEPGWPLLGRGSSGAGFPLGPRREVLWD